LRITADRIGLELCAIAHDAQGIHVHKALSGTITTQPFACSQHQCVSVHFGLLMAIYTNCG